MYVEIKMAEGDIISFKEYITESEFDTDYADSYQQSVSKFLRLQKIVKDPYSTHADIKKAKNEMKRCINRMREIVDSIPD